MPINRASVQALLIIMMFNNQRVASGTAFVVQGQKDPLLITNRHNVTGRHHETGAPLDKKHGAIPNTLEVLHNVTRSMARFPTRSRSCTTSRASWATGRKKGSRFSMPTDRRGGSSTRSTALRPISWQYRSRKSRMSN
jgi:hypothetical protein